MLVESDFGVKGWGLMLRVKMVVVVGVFLRCRFLVIVFGGVCL